MQRDEALQATVIHHRQERHLCGGFHRLQWDIAKCSCYSLDNVFSAAVQRADEVPVMTHNVAAQQVWASQTCNRRRACIASMAFMLGVQERGERVMTSSTGVVSSSGPLACSHIPSIKHLALPFSARHCLVDWLVQVTVSAGGPHGTCNHWRPPAAPAAGRHL